MKFISEKFLTFLKNFLENYSNTESKYFQYYMCFTFSCLINGLILVFVGTYPALFLDLPSNYSRVLFGSSLIATWFFLLPMISKDTYDKIGFHLAASVLATISFVSVCSYWRKYMETSVPMVSDFPILILSLATIGYFIYCFGHLVMLVFLLMKKILKKVLPSKGDEKSGLAYTLEAISSLLVAISSFMAAIWGLVTAIKTLFP